MKKVTFSVPIDSELLAKARRLAKRHGITVNALIEILLLRELAARRAATGGAA